MTADNDPVDRRPDDPVVDLQGRIDVVLPVGPVVGAAIVLHPHPDYGGDRYNPVSSALWEALPTLGLVTIRFDFSSSDPAVATAEAVAAARQAIAAAVEAGVDLADGMADAAAPGESAPMAPPPLPVPLVVAGYSFGSMIGLRVPGTVPLEDPGEFHDDLGGQVVARILVAPPLGTGLGGTVRPPTEPTLVFTPAHDQYAPPEVARAAIAAWQQTTFEVVQGGDHFLAGRTKATAERATAWLAPLLQP